MLAKVRITATLLMAAASTSGVAFACGCVSATRHATPESTTSAALVGFWLARAEDAQPLYCNLYSRGSSVHIEVGPSASLQHIEHAGFVPVLAAKVSGLTDTVIVLGEDRDAKFPVLEIWSIGTNDGDRMELDVEKVRVMLASNEAELLHRSTSIAYNVDTRELWSLGSDNSINVFAVDVVGRSGADIPKLRWSFGFPSSTHALFQHMVELSPFMTYDGRLLMLAVGQVSDDYPDELKVPVIVFPDPILPSSDQDYWATDASGFMDVFPAGISRYTSKLREVGRCSEPVSGGF